MPYTGTLIPFAVEISRASPLRMPIRNLVISRGDDTTLALTIYDGDGLALDLTTDVLTLTVLDSDVTAHGYGWGSRGDYGMGWATGRHRVLWQASAVTMDPLLGTAQVTLPREVTNCWSGRYDMLLSLDNAFGGAIIARGLLDVRRGLVLPRPPLVPPLPFPPADTLTGIGAFDPALGGPGIGLFDNVGLAPQLGIGALDPAIGGPGIGLFDDIALLPTAALGQGALGQFRLG